VLRFNENPQVPLIAVQISFGLQRSAPGARVQLLRAALRVLPVIGEIFASFPRNPLHALIAPDRFAGNHAAGVWP
jgi:hypothetical protein